MILAIWGPPKLPSEGADVLSRGIEKGTRNPDFIKRVEETLFYSAEFRPGPVMRNTIIDFGVKYGPAFAEAFK
jgi:hypothetical protein